MPRQLRALLWVALVLVSAAPGIAQPGYLRDRDRELEGRKRLIADLQRARLQFGPFYLLSTIELRNLGLQEEIDVPTRDELDDLTATIAAPQKLYFVPTRKFVLSAEVEPAYVWFRDREALRTWNYNTRADIHFLWNRLYLDLYGRRSDETVRDISEFGLLANRESRGLGLEAELKFSSKTDAILRATDSDLEYSTTTDLRGDVERLERNEKSSWLGFRHKTFPRTALTFAGQATRYDFATADDRDGEMYAVYVGAERAGTGARLIEEPVQIRVGYATLDYEDPSETDYRGAVGRAEVSHAPQRNLILTSVLERRIEFSIFENNNHYAADRLRFGGTYSATRRVDVLSTAEFGVNRYFIAAMDLIDSDAKKRRDDIAFYSVGLRYRVRNSTAGLGAGYYQRDSNFDEFDEDGIRLLVQLSISP